MVANLKFDWNLTRGRIPGVVALANCEIITATALELSGAAEDAFIALVALQAICPAIEKTVSIAGNTSGTWTLASGNAQRVFLGYIGIVNIGADDTNGEITVDFVGSKAGSTIVAANLAEALTHSVSLRVLKAGEAAVYFAFFATTVQGGEYVITPAVVEYHATTPLTAAWTTSGGPTTMSSTFHPITPGSKYWVEVLEAWAGARNQSA